jgi:hypothetical protein
MWAPGYASAADTGTIAVCATDSTGANIVLGNDQAWYKTGSTYYVGAVGTSGCRESTLAAGTNVEVWVAKNGTYSQHLTGTVPDGSTLRFDFYTTNVTIQYPGQVAFGGPHGDSAWFKQTAATASMELLSDGVDPTMFRASSSAGYVHDIAVSWPVATGTGKSATFSLMAMRVRNNDGTGEAGATAVYKAGLYSYFAPGSTNADGLLGWAHAGLQTDVTVTAKVNNTTSSQTQDVSSVGLFDFQTTNLTLNYSEDVRYFYNSTYASFFDKPSMELFAGTYPFQFRSGAVAGNPGAAYSQVDITVPDPSQGPITKSAAVVRFQDSTGAGLVGSVSYYLQGWHNAVADTDMGAAYFSLPANTGSEPGSAVLLFDGAPTNVVFALTYNGTRQQLPTQNIQTNSVAYFHTTDVAVELRNHLGNPIDTGDASYYASGWHTIGTTSSGVVHVQMLPGSYSFAMTFDGTRQQLNGQAISGATTTVTFTTTLVFVELQDHYSGILDIPANGSASYYTSGWHAITTEDSNNHRIVQTEMLPGSYSFAVTYLGTRDQKSQTIGTGPLQIVYFHTGAVHSDAGTATSYYASGWKPFTQDMELLPGAYWFRFSDIAQTNYTLVGGTGAVNHIH